MHLSYAGTHYCGWQTQLLGGEERKDVSPSIQSTLQEAILQMTGEKASVVGSGRTDSGVHAVGQVAHFVLRKKEWQPAIILKGLNSILPESIRVLAVKPVPIEFHAQRDAIRKQYSYYFQQGPNPIPHLSPYSRWIFKRLDIVAMDRAVKHLIGEHDFKPFQASGAKVTSTVRTILEAEVVWQDIAFPQMARFHWTQGHNEVPAGFVRVRLMGTGFLKQMVRGIAGTLLQVGEGRKDPDCMKRILETQDRTALGMTAPGKGLWLEQVWYPEEYGLMR